MKDGEIIVIGYPGESKPRTYLYHLGADPIGATCMQIEICSSPAVARARFDDIKADREKAQREFLDRMNEWAASARQKHEFRMATLDRRFADFCVRLKAAQARVQSVDMKPSEDQR